MQSPNYKPLRYCHVNFIVMSIAPVQADLVQTKNDLQEKLSFRTGKSEITSFKMRAKIEHVRAMEEALIKNKIVNETMKD